uniref:Uncharacterized protein n=1 Tax=viral metagenome TaxID=1070528 RepID=A0A6M3IKS3_9ZZZZ
MTPSSIITTWKGIAKFLGVSEQTARRLHKECGLPVRLAGRAYADPKALLAWVRGGTIHIHLDS